MVENIHNRINKLYISIQHCHLVKKKSHYVDASYNYLENKNKNKNNNNNKEKKKKGKKDANSNPWNKSEWSPEPPRAAYSCFGCLQQHRNTAAF